MEPNSDIAIAFPQKTIRRDVPLRTQELVRGREKSHRPLLAKERAKKVRQPYTA
jgi:hypothetical protein